MVQPLQVVIAADYSDAGQRALWAASESSDNFAFRFDLPDGVSRRVFIALVGGIRERFDAANDVLLLTTEIYPNSPILRATQ